MSHQLSEEISELRSNEERMKSLYCQSYQHTWSPMSSNIPPYNRDTTIRDLEGISLCMEYPTIGHYDTPTYPVRNDYASRRASLPYTSKPSKPRGSSLITDLHTARRFRLEKIPEVPTGPSSNGNEDDSQNVDNSSNSSNSDSSHKPIVAPDNNNDTN